MKIGFIGNVNNYPFPIALAMRERGVDVRFVIDRREKLHRPEFCYPELAGAYDDWLFDLSPIRLRHIALPSAKRRRIVALMADRDALVVNDLGIALSTFLDKPTFVIVSGSDLDVMANEQHLPSLSSSGVLEAFKALFVRRVVRRQRMGFRLAAGVDYTLPGMQPHGDALLDDLGVVDERRFALMPTDLDRFPVMPPPDNQVLRILAGARLCWCEPLPPGFGVQDNKRNDILLRGVAEYRRRTEAKLELRLPRKGIHLEQTQALVRELAIDDLVVWMDEMSQSDFSREVLAADIVADHFGEGSVGMVVRQAMAMGRPVIARGKSEIFENHLGQRLPIADAATPDGVADAIARLSDRNERRRAAIIASDYTKQYFSARNAADVIVDRLARRLVDQKSR